MYIVYCIQFFIVQCSANTCVRLNARASSYIQHEQQDIEKETIKTKKLFFFLLYILMCKLNAFFGFTVFLFILNSPRLVPTTRLFFTCFIKI